jgi:hypothetical protein
MWGQSFYSESAESRCGENSPEVEAVDREAFAGLCRGILHHVPEHLTMFSRASFLIPFNMHHLGRS